MGNLWATLRFYVVIHTAPIMLAMLLLVPHERGNMDTRAWNFGRLMNESG